MNLTGWLKLVKELPVLQLDTLFRTEFESFVRNNWTWYSPHVNEVVMEYGYGPGNDLAGWVVYSEAKRIVGVDVSRRALELA